ncbi:hypothetical protein DFH29DRAFT_1050180 [Suillus ampliporus]|nr:hypothetical protein DFH29DRAFT_1050180 [Suillus ampliporus]
MLNILKHVVISLLGYFDSQGKLLAVQIESGVNGDPHILPVIDSYWLSAIADIAQVATRCDCIWCRINSDSAGEAGSGQSSQSSHHLIRSHEMCRSSMASSRFVRAPICNIAEELRCHILSFLSYHETICCASISKTFYNTIKNSVELQYTIELGAQRLIPIHPRPPTVSVAECLRVLRDKASAWSSFELNVTQRLRFAFIARQRFRDRSTSSFVLKSVTHQQLNIFTPTMHGDVISKIIDLRTCTPETTSAPPCTWMKDSPNPIPGSFCCLDEMQDLLVFATAETFTLTPIFVYQIYLRTISTGEGHPLAHGCRLVPRRVTFKITGIAPCNTPLLFDHVAADVLGDRLAFYGTSTGLGQGSQKYWSLYVWNWYQGGPADAELYNVEDLSKPPQLHASFALSVSGDIGQFQFPSMFHSASSCAGLTGKHWIWTTNPADRVISVVTGFPWSILVIHARMFFTDIPPTWFDVTSRDGRTVPWSLWGPRNSRFFPRVDSPFGVGGSRVVWAVPVSGSSPALGFRLHMTDFNPSAVARGIGKVVRKPSSINFGNMTTWLPYVELVNDRVFPDSLDDIILDEEKLLVFTKANDETVMLIHQDPGGSLEPVHGYGRIPACSTIPSTEFPTRTSVAQPSKILAHGPAPSPSPSSPSSVQLPHRI